MTLVRKLLTGSVVGVVVLLACQPKDTGPTKAVPNWLGATPHFRAEGFLKDRTISIDLKGADAEDTTKLYCRREYFAESDGGVLDVSTAVPSENKIIYKFAWADGGVESAEIELKRHDFRSNKKDDKLTIVPRDDANQPTGSNFWFEYQTMDPVTNAKTLEYGAQSGDYVHGEYACDRDPARPAICADKQGDVGGYVSAVWNATDHLDVSFTAHCAKDVIEAKP